MTRPARLLAGACLLAVTAPLLERTVVPIRGQAPELEAVQSESTDVEHATAVLRALNEDLPYVPGEVLVRFKPGIPQTQGEAALRVLRTPIEPGNTRWIGPTLHLRGLAIEDPVRAAENLARQPEVLYAQPNYLIRLDSVPNDTGWSQQWNLPLINMPQAWDINTSAGGGVTVAVVDSGLTTRDGAFGFRLWTTTGFQTLSVSTARTEDFDHGRVQGAVDLQTFGRWTSGGAPLIFDAVGHGTHVAGTIAQQTNNSAGYAGVANGVTLMPIKACYGPWDVQMYINHVLGGQGFASPLNAGCESAAVIEGIRRAADNGAKVINLSLGGPSAQPGTLDALNYAVSKGAFVAIAAGNEFREGNPASYPAFYASQIEGVMAVAAVTPTRERAGYSNTGSYVEIAAPGGAGSGFPSTDQVWQIGPNQLDLLLAPFRSAPAFNRYQNAALAGTSMATPHVAALAALLYSQGVTKPSAIEAAIKRFARDLGPAGRDDEFGFGMIDARATLRGLGVTR
jgi:serine protease